MAIVKFVAAASKYQDDTARHDLIRYMTQKSKTPNHIVGFSHGDIRHTADQMTNTAKAWNKAPVSASVTSSSASPPAMSTTWNM